MEVPRGWNVLQMPAQAPNFNVSGFVVPGGSSVGDDDRQMSLWPGDPSTRDFLEVVRVQAQALQEALALHRELLQHLVDPDLTPPQLKRPHQPQNKQFRDWESFRAHLQEVERRVRRDNHLRPADLVTKEMIYAAGGPAPRTLLRIMVDTHGLQPDQWPPSTWPVESPLET